MGRAIQVTAALRRYDNKLFCRQNREGKLCVYREGTYWESYILDDNATLRIARSAPHLAFALTHNWKESGYSVDWGIEPIMKKVRDSDLWNRDIVSDLEKQDERHKEDMERHRKNETESFLYDFRSEFKKTFNDVNTSNLEKKDLRKKNEKRIKN